MNYIYSNLGTAMDIINPQGNDTNVNFKKQSIQTNAAAGRLLLMIPFVDSWKERIFDSTQTRIIISENSAESDIPPNLFSNFKGSLVLQKCEDKWILLNSGRAGVNFTFNGENKNHLVIERGEKAIVTNNTNLLFIILFLDNEGHVKKDVRNGEIQYGEFSLQKDGIEHCFSREKLCLLGKSEYCNINPSGNSDFVAAIYNKNAEMMIAPLDPKTPVTLNSTPVTEPRLLYKNSTIIINQSSMLFNVFNDGDSVEPRIDSGAEKIGAEKLVLIPTARNSDGSRKSMLYIPIAGKSVFVGRDATQAQIVINRNVVSKKHAQIISYEHSIMLLDCYSTNGTFVNGEKISKRTVHPGDTIEFGEEKYILSYV